MQAFERLISKLSLYSAYVGGLAMIVMTFQVTLDVVLKYLLSYPIPATLETVSSYYMVALIFLPLGLVTRDKEHICVELFTQGLSERRLALVNALAGILAAAYIGVMAVRSTEEAWAKTAIRESWETAIWDMEVWPSRWFVSVGTTLMFIYLLIHVVDNIAVSIRGRGTLTTSTTEPAPDR